MVIHCDSCGFNSLFADENMSGEACICEFLDPCETEGLYETNDK